MEPNERTTTLIDLVCLRVPVEAAITAVRALPWDSEEDLVLLDRSAASSVLRRYGSGEITADDLEAWANAIEGREDVGFEAGQDERLSRFIFETANPALAQPLDETYSSRWLAELSPLP